MEIPASRATLAQVQRGRDGRMVEIEADVCNVAQDLRDIKPSLRLRWSEAGGYFVVYDSIELSDGSVVEHLVLTAQQLDQRIVKEVRKAAGPGYDLVAEMEADDRRIDRERAHAEAERLGNAAERLWHALRQDVGASDRMYVPDTGRPRKRGGFLRRRLGV